MSATAEDDLTSLSRPPVGSNVDSDFEGDSDAAPDYRFLTTTTKTSHKLPARGEKDFEPNATNVQQDTLDVSRQHMHDALSVSRVHTAGNVSIGQYYPDQCDWDGVSLDLVSEQDDGVVKEQACYFAQVTVHVSTDGEPVRAMRKLRNSGALKPGEGRCVAVEKFLGSYSKSIGAGDRRGWTWLLPEEALFLLERGSLDIRWPDPPEEDMVTQVRANAQDDRADSTVKLGELPMSLQGAYSSLVGKGNLSLERYTVYANLRRAGYIVLRAPTWDGEAEKSERDDIVDDIRMDTNIVRVDQPPLWLTINPFHQLHNLFVYLFTPSTKPLVAASHDSHIGPLIPPSIFRNHFDIFRHLHLIPSHRYTSPTTQDSHDLSSDHKHTGDSPLLPTYHLYKPSTISSNTWRKTAPPAPDHRLIVLDARTTSVPTSSQLGDLFQSMPHNSLPNDKKLETRVKHGQRSVMLAIVDCGLVSYMRMSGGGFCEDNILWRENEKRQAQRRGAGPGAKRGGFRGRGRGRGRHRS